MTIRAGGAPGAFYVFFYFALSQSNKIESFGKSIV